MNQKERDRFDALLDRVLRDLPLNVRELFDEAPILIDDRPSRSILEEFDLDPHDDTLCGLYSGTPMTERSVNFEPHSPDHIYLFREGIVQHAGGWDECNDDEGVTMGGEQAIAREIRITILHELGHHFGLDEDDLLKMGYD